MVRSRWMERGRKHVKRLRTSREIASAEALSLPAGLQALSYRFNVSKRFLRERERVPGDYEGASAAYAFCTTTAPKYSLSSKLPRRFVSLTPGPGRYHCSSDSSLPAFTFSKTARVALKLPGETPGPGAYAKPLPRFCEVRNQKQESRKRWDPRLHRDNTRTEKTLPGYYYPRDMIPESVKSRGRPRGHAYLAQQDPSRVRTWVDGMISTNKTFGAQHYKTATFTVRGKHIDGER